jgi:hypothetical protein
MNDLKNHSIGGMVQKVQGKFNTFKSSIPLHFDMLHATPYSLSEEGNLVVGRFNLGTIFQMKNCTEIAFEVCHFFIA